jgi:hypothetical protein
LQFKSGVALLNKRLERLNGYQRIGVVASIIWILLVLGFAAYELNQYERYHELYDNGPTLYSFSLDEPVRYLFIIEGRRGASLNVFFFLVLFGGLIGPWFIAYARWLLNNYLERPNGYKWIYIVASIIWIVSIGCFAAYEFSYYSVISEDFFVKAVDSKISLNSFFFLVLFGGQVGLWLILYAPYYAYRWIVAGFKK